MALASVGLACAGVQPPRNPGEPELRRFDVEGTKEVSEELIRSRIVTSGPSWLPFAHKRTFNESAFEGDLKRIVRLYAAYGFYKAKTVESRVTPAGENAVDVLVLVDEGPPTRVRSLAITGLEAVPDDVRTTLLEKLPLREGDVFREGAFDSLKAALAERLREAGFAEAEVASDAVVDLPSDRADIVMRTTPGPRYRFGEVFVAGASQVPRERIAENARTAIHPGELYSESAMAEARRRVADLGVFSTVRVSRGAPDRRDRTIPVVITVREAPFKTLRVGAGFGVDPRRTEVPRATAEWTHRNAFGGLRRLSVNGDAALVFLPSLFTLLSAEKPRVDVALTTAVRFEQPDFIGRSTRFTSSIGYERGVDQSFTYNSVNGNVGVVYRHRRIFDFVPSYNISVFRITGPAPEAAATTTTQEAVLDECSKNQKVCLLTYLEQRVGYDRRDSSVAPTRGAYVSLSLQEGSRFLGGQFDYLRLLPEARFYVPLGPHVLAARFMAGLLRPYSGEGSSVLTRFFLGGNNSQRGFGYRQLAPTFVTCRNHTSDTTTHPPREICATDSSGNIPTEALPVGGNGMLAGNLELRLALPASFGLVTFVDAGEVTPLIENLTWSGIHVAIGLGLRYRTVFGPVRLDVAYRLNTPNIFDTAATFDVFDPELPQNLQKAPSVSRIAVQFSIGEAF